MKAHAASRVFLLFLLFTCAQLAEAARAPLLRYRLPEEKTNVYSLQIELRGETGTDILTGNLFVTTKPGPSKIITLGFRGTLSPKRDANPRPPIMSGGMMGGSSYPRWPSSVSLNDAEIQFDERGRLLRVAGDYPLPVPLGSIAQALVESLPAKAESRWEVTDELAVIDEPAGVGPGALFLSAPSGYSPYSYGGSYGQRAGAVVSVTRKVRYEVRSSTPTEITVTKRIGLDSHLTSGSEPHISASGEGEFVLNPKTGQLVTASLDCKGVVNNESVTRRTTTTLRLKLLEGAELATALRPPIQTSTPTSSYPPKKLTREEVEKLLEDLKSADATARMNAMSKLQTSELVEAPPALLEFMNAKLAESDSSMRYVAVKIIADYGTKDDVPTLMKWLKSDDSSSRYAAIRGLGRLKEKSAAEPIAAMLATGGSDGYQAVEALTKIGPDAEDAVLPLLQEKHIETRRQVCNVLKQIGTKKSLDPLRELMLSKDRQVNEAAAEAVRAIVARQQL